jgi:hypothetical protein
MAVVVGVSEERVRAIIDEKLQIALKDFSDEANRIAQGRNEKFSEKLIDRMVKKHALDAFADPSFQVLLVEAQKRAASSERECDYDLLAELMVRRFESGGDRLERAGVSKAVEIVDQVSDEALLGLTIVHAVLQFVPMSGGISSGLKVLNDLYGKLLYAELPVGSGWLDHLDILGAIRISALGGVKPFEECLIQKLPGYMVEGIEKGSEDFNRAIDKLQSVGLGDKVLIDHELTKDRVRLALVGEEQIRDLRVIRDGLPARSATQEQQEALRDVFALSNQKQISKQRVVEEIEKYPSMKLIREWWNKLENGLRITSIGQVLAHANAQRIDSTLPPL